MKAGRSASFALVVSSLACGRVAADPVVVVDPMADAGVDAPGVARSGGLVSLANTDTDWAFGAMFYGSGPSCTVARVDGCDVSSCFSWYPWDTPARFEAIGAVEVTVGTTVVDLALQKDATYVSTGLGRLWNGGEPLRAHVSGSAGTSFDFMTLAPSLVTLTAPVIPVGATVPRRNPLQVAWAVPDAGEGAIVAEVVNDPNGPLPAVRARCTFALQDGHGEIPASVLQRLPAGPGGILVTSSIESTLPVGDRDVRFEAFSVAIGPPGATNGITLVWE